MSKRRMFSQKIVESDAFLDMPVSSQLLYFHLGMEADDDGFVNPRKIIRMIGAANDDLKVLMTKRFVIPFESGVVVIKHWAINNLIRKDWHKTTVYIDELKLLKIKENGAYTEVDNTSVNTLLTETQPNINKFNLTKLNLIKEIGAEAPPSIKKDVDLKEKTEKFIKEVKDILEGYPDIDFNNTEIIKFCSYWTEPNKSGKRLRWELQPTFEIKRRLSTWILNSNSFKNKDKYKATMV